MEYKQWNNNFKFVIGIDPAGIGTTGIYANYNPNIVNKREWKIEIESTNEIEAAYEIINQISLIEKDVGHKFDKIGVERVQDYIVSYNKKKPIPYEVRMTDRLDAILAATYTTRYVGIRPDWKSKREYDSIKKNAGKFNRYKKSEHIIDAKLIYDRTRDTFLKNKKFYNYKGAIINESF